MTSPVVQLISAQIAAGSPGSSPSGLFDGGFSWGLVLLCTAGVAALVFICSLGFIARLRDRAAEREANLQGNQRRERHGGERHGREGEVLEDHPTIEG